MQESPPSQIFRFTSVLTARNGSMRYFRSPDEVPKDLQRHIDRALQGNLTANIILADEGGQKYLQTRVQPKVQPSPQLGWRRLLARRLILEAAGAFAVALALWVLAATK